MGSASTRRYSPAGGEAKDKRQKILRKKKKDRFDPEVFPKVFATVAR
jgi:hypothetical protein